MAKISSETGKNTVTLSRFAKQSVSKGLLERVVKVKILIYKISFPSTKTIPIALQNAMGIYT
ncbi:MAG: hypothetical protein Tsb005_20440 [Gammaproteobacteria bacterium]